MAFYAGETIVLGAELTMDDDDPRPLTPQPSGGVSFEVLDEASVVLLAKEIGVGVRLRDDNGTATAGGALTLTCSTKNWNANQWAGYLLRITAGTGSGQERRILSNTATSITVEDGTAPGQGAWQTNPASDSTFDIHRSRYEYSWASPAAQQGKSVQVIVRASDTYLGIEKSRLRLD